MPQQREGADVRRGHVCPWWVIRTFDNPLRRLFHRPEYLLSGLVQPGDHCLDVGCGIGYFTIPLAAMVGDRGSVTAVDVQPRMLEGVARRAAKRGLSARIRLRLATDVGPLADQPVDFVLAFWMWHEVPDQASLLRRLLAALRPGGRFLLVEPRLHVSGKAFAASVARATAVGFEAIAEPAIALSRAVVLIRKSPGGGSEEPHLPASHAETARRYSGTSASAV